MEDFEGFGKSGKKEFSLSDLDEEKIAEMLQDYLDIAADYYASLDSTAQKTIADTLGMNTETLKNLDTDSAKEVIAKIKLLSSQDIQTIAEAFDVKAFLASLSNTDAFSHFQQAFQKGFEEKGMNRQNRADNKSLENSEKSENRSSQKDQISGKEDTSSSATV